MTIKPLGDTALLIEVAEQPGEAALTEVQRVTQALQQGAHGGIREIVPALTTVGVHLQPSQRLDPLRAWVEKLLRDLPARARKDVAATRVREIPVRYGGNAGPDLERVARHTGLPQREIIERHVTGRYRVAAMGFAPGFPYLIGLDPDLACPRLDSPRREVPSGSVGIGGAQTGVYPQALPGGWNLIGRTPQTLFDPTRSEPAWLRVGDEVRFVPTKDLAPREPTATGPSARPPIDGQGWIEVESGGVQATIQDLGRWGYQSLGVCVGGAVNPRAAAVANLLVGNDRGAAAIEWALRGPRLRFNDSRVIAIAGAAVLDRPLGQPFLVQAGEVVDLRNAGANGRGYLAVSGGVAVPPVLGSASTHLGTGFGGWQGRTLRAGDQLPLGEPAAVDFKPGWRVPEVWIGGGQPEHVAVRVLRGPEAEALGEKAWHAFIGQKFTLTPDSNRMGMRLRGRPIEPEEPVELVSQPVAWGTVQLPPNGQPVVLMSDRQSLGGYPRIASVISADLATLAQVPLGRAVRFIETDEIEAEALRREEQRDLGMLAMATRQRLVFSKQES